MEKWYNYRRALVYKEDINNPYVLIRNTEGVRIDNSYGLFRNTGGIRIDNSYVLLRNTGGSYEEKVSGIQGFYKR